MIKSRSCRIDNGLAALRKQHTEIASRALNGLRITETSIDKIYTQKLRNMNIVEEILKKGRITK